MTTASASSSPLRCLGIIAADIKLAHSVFAMPFALLAAFMASPWSKEKGISELAFSAHARRIFAGQIVLVVLAMIFARTVAMLANRWLDREIDRLNPRTMGRALASGQLSSNAAIGAMAACALGFMVVCAAFGMFHGNWWPTILGVPVLAWISAYGLLKRCTWLCHLYLGSSLAISPLAAAIAIDPMTIVPTSSSFQPAIPLVSAMVLCWVAGFDIIYALQDVEVDRAQNLHSMPARLGVKNAMWISRALHALSVACLLACWRIDPRFGALFLIGVIIVAVLLMYEHLTVARWGTTKIALAFFTLNGVISCVLGVLGIFDLVLA